MNIKKIEVTDPFLYDLHQLAFNANKLCALLRDLRVVVETADMRWKKSNVGNKEAAKRQERKPYIEGINKALRDFNVALYSLDDKNDAPWDINLQEHIERWGEHNHYRIRL